jgi:hypothetical protein
MVFNPSNYNSYKIVIGVDIKKISHKKDRIGIFVGFFTNLGKNTAALIYHIAIYSTSMIFKYLFLK